MRLQRAYKFRLYPTPAQVAELSEWERQLRRIWNLAHEQRLTAMTRHVRPDSPDVDECRSCGVPKVDETEHVSTCAGGGYHESVCRGCGVLKAGKATKHAPSCVRGGYRSACRGCSVERKMVAHHTGACAFVDYYRQNREMTSLLEDDQLVRVVWSARQEVLRDLEKAWQRWRSGLGGKPHFKRRHDAVHIYIVPDNWKVELGTLSFRGMASSVGAIQIKQDRPWPKDVKFSSCHVVRDVGEWYVVFPLEFSEDAARAKGGAVGINRGAVHAIADSFGRVIDSPRYYAKSLAVVQRRSRQLARKVNQGQKPAALAVKYRGLDPAQVDGLAREFKTTSGKVVYEARRLGGLEQAEAHLRAHPPAPLKPALLLPSDGKNRERARVRLALAHQTIRRRRAWFLHEESAYYARTYAKVAIERWSTRAMTSSEPQIKDGARELRRVTRGRNRSILDVGWAEFGRQLEYKVLAHGGEFLPVDPGLRATEAAAFDIGDDPPNGEHLRGEAGISGTCSTCGAVLEEPASGRMEAVCLVCAKVELGDVNAAKNVLLRALFPRKGEEAPVKKKVSIGIKGKKRRAA